MATVTVTSTKAVFKPMLSVFMDAAGTLAGLRPLVLDSVCDANAATAAGSDAVACVSFTVAPGKTVAIQVNGWLKYWQFYDGPSWGPFTLAFGVAGTRLLAWDL